MTVPLLKGVDEIIDDWLGLLGCTEYGSESDNDSTYRPKYKSKRAAIDLSKIGRPRDNDSRSTSSAIEMISKTMACIEANHLELGVDWPARSNWRWEKSCHLSSHSKSLEKQLEKYTAFLLDDRWVNQVPVCNRQNGGANACRIDLVFQIQNSEYEFIELKYGHQGQGHGADNPLYAAMELLRYGLVYLLFRKDKLLGNSSSQFYRLLKAETIHLVVLAPSGWYQFGTRGGAKESFQFRWLEESINEGLKAYLESNRTGLEKMDIRFDAFQDGFGEVYRPLTEAISRFRAGNLDTRTAVYHS